MKAIQNPGAEERIIMLFQTELLGKLLGVMWVVGKNAGGYTSIIIIMYYVTFIDL